MKFLLKTTLPLLALLATSTILFASSATFSNIDQRSGWSSCDTCAGINGAGSTAPHSLTQGVSSPSLDGKSAKFWIGGSTPYSDVLWWNRLGGNSASHFVYSFYFYLQNPNAPQALEFDVNDSIYNKWWVFGTECNYRQYGTWRVWDTAGKKWVSTGITCVKPKAYTWNHVVLEFQRVNGKALFVAVTFNGTKHYINRSYYPKSNPGGYQISVAFQADGNYAQTDYSTWIDKLQLKYW